MADRLLASVIIVLSLLPLTATSDSGSGLETGSGETSTAVTCMVSGPACHKEDICGEYVGLISHNHSELVRTDSQRYLQSTTIVGDDFHAGYWFIATSSWAEYETDGYFYLEQHPDRGPWDGFLYVQYHEKSAFCNAENPTCPGVSGAYGDVDGHWYPGGAWDGGELGGCDVRLECSGGRAGAECCASEVAYGECVEDWDAEPTPTPACDEYDERYVGDGRGCPGNEGGCSGGCCLSESSEWCSDNYRQGYVCVNNACGDDDCCIRNPLPAVLVGIAIFFVLLISVAMCITRYCCRCCKQQQRRQTVQQHAATGAGSTSGIPMATTAERRTEVDTPVVPMGTPVAAQAVPVAPAMTSVMVQCPPGVRPGDTVQVAGPTGQVMHVTVPGGVAEGQQFMVQMPAAPPVVMAHALPSYPRSSDSPVIYSDSNLTVI